LQDAIALFRDTPQWRRGEFAREIWERRRARGTDKTGVPFLMRLFAHATVAENNDTKEFTLEQFESVVRSHFFMGAVTFWREVERLAEPSETTRTHERGVLRMLAQLEYRGLAFSPEHASALTVLRSAAAKACGQGIAAKGGSQGTKRWRMLTPESDIPRR
jgi:hypothetical protein